VLVRSWTTRHDDGTIDVLIWNGTVNAELMSGAPRLQRTAQVSVTGLAGHGYGARMARIDNQHSNILAGYPEDTAWPDDELWRALHARDRLHEQDIAPVPAGQASARFEVDVPMPGVVRIRLTPPGVEGVEKEGQR
jgi:xylan 1,4-beta-xylosidase